jgi:hypothetical protein
VQSAGFRIYFGAPAFFIESSDALMLDRGPRIAQAFAGPYFELVAAGIASIVLWATPGIALDTMLYRFVVESLLERLVRQSKPCKRVRWVLGHHRAHRVQP